MQRSRLRNCATLRGLNDGGACAAQTRSQQLHRHRAVFKRFTFQNVLNCCQSSGLQSRRWRGDMHMRYVGSPPWRATDAASTSPSFTPSNATAEVRVSCLRRLPGLSAFQLQRRRTCLSRSAQGCCAQSVSLAGREDATHPCSMRVAAASEVSCHICVRQCLAASELLQCHITTTAAYLCAAPCTCVPRSVLKLVASAGSPFEIAHATNTHPDNVIQGRAVHSAAALEKLANFSTACQAPSGTGLEHIVQRWIVCEGTVTSGHPRLPCSSQDSEIEQTLPLAVCALMFAPYANGVILSCSASCMHMYASVGMPTAWQDAQYYKARLKRTPYRTSPVIKSNDHHFRISRIAHTHSTTRVNNANHLFAGCIRSWQMSATQC